MKDNFFNSMFSEGGKISHKRWISVTCSAVVCFISTWAAVHYPQFIPGILNSLLIFISVMSGVATVAQIASIITRTPQPKEKEDDGNKPVMGESLPPGNPGGNPPHSGS